MSHITSKQGGTNQFSRHRDKRKASFFKIIHPDIIKDQQLDLPIMFVKKYENDFSGDVTLKVPTGNVWNMKLRKVNGRTYLCDGWKEFVDHHSICAGYVLTFRYDGNSSFYVIICDMTTAEIEYPSKKVKLEDPAHGRETLVPGKNVVELNGDKSTHKLTAQLGELSVKNGQSRKLMAKERIKAMMPSKPKNPYFVLVMQPSSVEGRCILNVPGSFMKKHIGKESCDITMFVSDDCHERIWRTRCIYYDNNVAKFAWKKFAKDNDLRENDVCMFELSQMKSVTFKVSIFREVEDVTPKVLRDTSKMQVFNQSECRTAKKKKVMNNGKVEALEVPSHGFERGGEINDGYGYPSKEKSKGKNVANRFLDRTVTRTRPMPFSFKSDYHFFIIKLSRTYVHGGLLQLPSSFIRKYLPKTESSVRIVDSKGRTWYVRYNLNSQGYLYQGWNTVVLKNNLKEGDVCAFELIDMEKFILRLSVL